jgi:capsular exopolysaccharide synthesis family protein
MTTLPATISERVPRPGMAAPGVPATAGLTPADILRMIRSRLVLIVALSIFLSAAAVGGFLLWYTKYPTYSAEAYIQCVSSVPKEATSLRHPQVYEDEHTRFLQDQALSIKQTNLLMRVLQTPEVRNTDWYQRTKPDERVDELDKSLSAGPIRDTSYIRVAMGTRSKADPHVIVRKVVDEYLSEARERATSLYRSELAKVEAEASELTQQIEAQNQQITMFAGTLPVGVLPGQHRQAMTVLEAQLLQNQQEVTELELQTQELQGLLEIYESPDYQRFMTEDRQLVELNPLVQQLIAQTLALEQEVTARLTKLGENHRDVQNLRNRLEQSQQQLQRMREQKFQEAMELKHEQVRTATFNSQHATFLAQERLEGVRRQQQDVERKLQEYRRMQDELVFLTATREKTIDYLRELRRIVAERSAVQIELRQPPVPPIERSRPRLYFAVVGVMLAVGLAVGFGVLLELMDTSVRTARDVVRHLGVPILGTVPDADDEEVHIDRIETVVHDLPRSMLAEAFRAIRTALQFSAPAERQRTLVVTSPHPEDGKTAVACNLAGSLAQGGRRVLLVDANFRRPALHRIYGQDNQAGLSNILIGAGRVEDYVRNTDLGNLDVLVSGPTPPNPAEQLSSAMMRQFLDEAVRRYDHVVLDAPPALLASDAAALGTMVDGTVLVLRAKASSRGVAQRALNLLHHVSAHVFGVVLNAAQAQRGGYFREQLRTFYDYHAEEDEESRSRQALPTGKKASALDGRPRGGDDEDEDSASA